MGALKAVRTAKKYAQQAKKNLRKLQQDTEEALQILRNVDLQMENQLTVEQVFHYLEPFLQREDGDKNWESLRDTYLLARKQLREVQDLQGERKAEMERVIEAMKGGEVSDENLNKHYETSRDLHLLLGQELHFLNLTACTGVTLLDKCKQLWGEQINVGNSTTTLQ
jgi:GH25 family lysozyme M1 (1,4-beta-N-acetylmuramidase)